MQFFKNVQTWWNDRNFIQNFEAVINAEKQKLARMNQTVQELEVTTQNPLADDETKAKALAELAEDGALKTEIVRLTQHIGYLEHLLINYRTTHGVGETSLIQKEIDEHKPEVSPPVKPAAAQLPVAPVPPVSKQVVLAPDTNRFNMRPLLKWLFPNSKSVIQNFENLLQEKQAALAALEKPPAPAQDSNERELEQLERIVDNEFVRKRLNEEIKTIEALLYKYQKTPNDGVLKQIEDILYREKPDLRPPPAPVAPAKPAAKASPPPPVKPPAPKLTEGEKVPLGHGAIGTLYKNPNNKAATQISVVKTEFAKNPEEVAKEVIRKIKGSLGDAEFAKQFCYEATNEGLDRIVKALHAVEPDYVTNGGKILLYDQGRKKELSPEEVTQKWEAAVKAAPAAPHPF